MCCTCTPFFFFNVGKYRSFWWEGGHNSLGKGGVIIFRKAVTLLLVHFQRLSAGARSATLEMGERRVAPAQAPPRKVFSSGSAGRTARSSGGGRGLRLQRESGRSEGRRPGVAAQPRRVPHRPCAPGTPASRPPPLSTWRVLCPQH